MNLDIVRDGTRLSLVIRETGQRIDNFLINEFTSTVDRDLVQFDPMGRQFPRMIHAPTVRCRMVATDVHVELCQSSSQNGFVDPDGPSLSANQAPVNLNVDLEINSFRTPSDQALRTDLAARLRQSGRSLASQILAEPSIGSSILRPNPVAPFTTQEVSVLPENVIVSPATPNHTRHRAAFPDMEAENDLDLAVDETFTTEEVCEQEVELHNAPVPNEIVDEMVRHLSAKDYEAISVTLFRVSIYGQAMVAEIWKSFLRRYETRPKDTLCELVDALISNGTWRLFASGDEATPKALAQRLTLIGSDPGRSAPSICPKSVEQLETGDILLASS
jgi:hypothetical protein